MAPGPAGAVPHARAVLRALPSLPEVGEVVGGRFEILDELGSGGTGHVYRVLDRRRQREIALKLIVPRYFGRRYREEWFFREASLGRRIGRHPHVVEILESGRLGDRDEWPFITMELVEGRGLPRDLVLHGPMNPLRASTIARQVADAIVVMHARGVVHRDISTRNMIVQQERVVVIDFSRAGDLNAPRIAAGGALWRLTRPNDIIGTHTCMAPEQARAEPPSTSMDIYAFGIMLFELLTGHNPHEDTARDAFLPELAEGKISPLQVEGEGVPHDLAEVVSACTEPDPDRRPNLLWVVEQLDHVMAAMGLPGFVSGYESYPVPEEGPAPGNTRSPPDRSVPSAADMSSDAKVYPTYLRDAHRIRPSPAPLPGQRRVLRAVVISVILSVVLTSVLMTWLLWRWTPWSTTVVGPDPSVGAGVHDGLEEPTGGAASVRAAEADAASETTGPSGVEVTPGGVNE